MGLQKQNCNCQTRTHAPMRAEKTSGSSPQGRGCVICPVAPGTACKPILEKKSYDCHHCQTAIVDLSEEALLLSLRVGYARTPRKAEGAIPFIVACELFCRALQVGHLDRTNKRHDLQPALQRDLGAGCKAIGDVRKRN